MTLVDALPRACFTEANLEEGANDDFACLDESPVINVGLLWNPLRRPNGRGLGLDPGCSLMISCPLESRREAGEGRL